MGQVQLSRALSKLGVLSRSLTKQYLAQGRIAVNKRVIKNPDFLIVPEKEMITIDGKLITAAAECTIALYKPRAVVTTRSDEKGRQTVYDLLPSHLKHLHPVGRLDMATTGLLIMTSNTQLSHFLTSPVNQVPRVYAVTVNGYMDDRCCQKLAQGIIDQGELLKPSTVHLRKVSQRESHLTIELTEGKNREIRRLMQAMGFEVIALKRIAFGKLKLGTLLPGQYKEINRDEII